jgi:hypothetical protein
MGMSVVEQRQFGEWTFEIGEDSGAATPGEVGIWLVKAPTGADFAPKYLRSFFFESDPWGHAEQFCEKVAGDGSYRADLTRGTLAFQKRDRIFERSLQWMDASVDFGPRSAISVGPGVTARQGRANVSAMHQTTERRDAAACRLLRFIDDHLEQIGEIDSSSFQPSREDLDPEIASGVQALNAAGIETVFSCQGISGLLVIDDVELVVEKFHEPLAYVQCVSLPERAAIRIAEDGAISLREWWPGQLRLVSPHPSANRAFGQAVARLGRWLS